MNGKISNSFKKEVEELQQWSDNGSERINDSKSSVSPLPRYERPYEPPISPVSKSILNDTFNYSSRHFERKIKVTERSLLAIQFCKQEQGDAGVLKHW